MGNLADYIEKFILLRLSGREDNSVVVNRNDLAQELDCAPSQISYVVNTRLLLRVGSWLKADEVLEVLSGSPELLCIMRFSKRQ